MAMNLNEGDVKLTADGVGPFDRLVDALLREVDQNTAEISTDAKVDEPIRHKAHRDEHREELRMRLTNKIGELRELLTSREKLQG